jgi:toxin YoeB
MRIVFSTQAWDDYQYWIKNDRKILKRINDLIKDTQRNPDAGLGKQEKLRNNLSGYSSKRITQEHRFVYRIEDEDLLIAQMRYHY